MQKEPNAVPDSAPERELAARSAVLIGRLFMVQGWQYSGTGGDHTAGVEEIAETIEQLIADSAEEGRASTGRLLVMRTDLGIETFLHLGTLYENGEVDVDDDRGGDRP